MRVTDDFLMGGEVPLREYLLLFDGPFPRPQLKRWGELGTVCGGLGRRHDRDLPSTSRATPSPSSRFPTALFRHMGASNGLDFNSVERS